MILYLKNTITYILFALLSVSFLSNLQARLLSLKELVNVAIKNAPSFKSSANEVMISKLKLRNSFAQFLPSFDLSTTQGYENGTPTKSNDTWGSQLTLGITEKLYNNGANFIGYNRSKKEKLKAEIQFNKERAQLFLEISLEYYNYSLLRKILDVQNFQYKLLKKQFLSIESKYKQGVKARIDYLRFKAKLSRSNLSLKQATVTMNKSLEEIKRIIAWKDDSLEIEFKQNESIKIKNIPTIVPELKNHYESRIAHLSKNINDFDVQIAKRRHLPEFFLESNITYNNSEYLGSDNNFQDNGQTHLETLLTIKFNLWDWGTRKRNVSIAKLSRNNLNHKIDSNLFILQATVRKLMLDIKQQKETFVLNKELASLEEKNYKSIERSYRNGRTTFLDLINSLNDYTAARKSFYQNIYQLKSFLAQYYFHKGILYETINNN